MFSRLIYITILTYSRSSHMGPDWIQSLWTRHHCTLDDPSYNQFPETLIRLRNEHDLEQGRNLALCPAKLILLAKKVQHYLLSSHIFSPINDHVSLGTSFHIAFTINLTHIVIDPRIKYYYCKRCNLPMIMTSLKARQHFHPTRDASSLRRTPLYDYQCCSPGSTHWHNKGEIGSCSNSF